MDSKTTERLNEFYYGVAFPISAVHFYAEGKTSSDDVMIMTLDQNGMIVTFDYCVNTPDNGFESKLFMKVDRQFE